jgi:hypothetical protein
MSILENPRIHQPGQPARYTGTYCCKVCGCEIMFDGIKGFPLPFADHHKHTADQPPIEWEYIGPLAKRATP